MLKSEAQNILHDLNNHGISGAIFRDLAFPWTMNYDDGIWAKLPNFVVITHNMIEIPSVSIGLKYIRNLTKQKKGDTL